MRVLPNLRHYIVRGAPELITHTLESFYGAFINGRTVPSLSWKKKDNRIVLYTSERPASAKLWQAVNTSARDFRKNEDKPDANAFTATPVHFQCAEQCQYESRISEPDKGWKAWFVEVTYDNAPFSDLSVTSRVFIYPDRYPDHK